MFMSLLLVWDQKFFSEVKKKLVILYDYCHWGGYVSIASEIADPPKGREKEVVTEKQLLENIHRGKKAVFLSSGALVNLILGFLLLIIGYAIFPYKQDLSLAPTFINYGPVYQAVNQYNSNSEHEIKINNNEIIVGIQIKDDETTHQPSINSYNDLTNWLSKYNGKNDENHLIITFNTKPKLTNIEVTTKKSDKYFLGVTASSYRLSSGQVIGDGFVDTFKNSYSVFQALGRLITFHWSSLSGPVGIIRSTSSFLDSSLTTKQSFSNYFRWAGLLSANLFLLNMMPIPPLDGYKFVENAVEAATRKKINSKFKIIISVIGAVLFLLIFIAITIKDILI